MTIISDITDKYFIRSKKILEAEGINPIVRYQVFAREDVESLEGIDEAINFIRGAGRDIKIYSKREGDRYEAGTPIMKLEGHVQDLIDLESYYLSVISGRLTGEIDLGEIRKNVRAIKQAAGDKPVYDFCARHFAPEFIVPIAKICYEEGFAGTSTDAGAEAWGAEGMGTTPHALFLTYAVHMQENGIVGNATVEGAKAFDRHVDSAVPRIILGCTFNREISDIVETAHEVPSFVGTRIDTCGENYTEGSTMLAVPKMDVDPKYFDGKGVSIASVWGVRQGLDRAGLGHLQISISSGFNAKKIESFMVADRKYNELYGKPLFDSIGSGSFAKPIMATSDICAYFSEKKNSWVPMSKVGRGELPSEGLEEVV